MAFAGAFWYLFALVIVVNVVTAVVVVAAANAVYPSANGKDTRVSSRIGFLQRRHSPVLAALMQIKHCQQPTAWPHRLLSASIPLSQQMLQSNVGRRRCASL